MPGGGGVEGSPAAIAPPWAGAFGASGSLRQATVAATRQQMINFFIGQVVSSRNRASTACRHSGFPITDCVVRLVGGSYHEVDSNGPAFEVAGSIAFQAAAEKAGVLLLEPIMRVEVTTPEDYLGDVIHDVNQRRGRVVDMGQRSNVRIVKVEAPLASMFGYATDLRSKTQGRADHTMQFSHFAALPPNLQEEIVARLRGYR